MDSTAVSSEISQQVEKGRIVGGTDETIITCDGSQQPSETEKHTISRDGQDVVATDNVNAVRGVRFALLFTCILLAAFFIGYVCVTSYEDQGRISIDS
jgi:hypothetical protein